MVKPIPKQKAPLPDGEVCSADSEYEEGLSYMMDESYAGVPDNEIVAKRYKKKPPPTHCLSCGKAICGYKCHHCGADQTTRISEKLMVVLALLLFVVGAVLIAAAAQVAEEPVRVISELTIDDAFAHVRLKGIVTDTPRYYPEPYDTTGTRGTIRFYLNDSTGQVLVKTAIPVTEDLINNSRVPALGDNVDVQGTLYVGDENFLSMNVITPKFFRIAPRVYTPMTIGDIDGADRSELPEYTKVEVTGTVGYVNALSWAFMFTLEDGQGSEVTVFMSFDIATMTNNGNLPENVYMDNTLTVRGALLWYDSNNDAYDGWEIIPPSVAAVQSNGTAAGETALYQTRTIDELMTQPDLYDNSLTKIIQCTVYSVSSNNEFMVTDVTSVANLTIFVETGVEMDGLEAGQELKQGDVVNVQGKFINYNGIWEIKVRRNSQDFVEVL